MDTRIAINSRRPSVLRLVLLLALVCATPPAVHSRENPREDQEEPPVELKFRTYARGSADYDALYYEESPGRYKPLPTRRGSRSRFLTYRGPETFTLYKREPSGDPEKEYLYRPVGAARARPGDSERLLLVTPRRSGNENEPAFTCAFLPSVRESIPSEHLAIYNGTGAPLRGMLGERTLELATGLSDYIPIGDEAGGRGVSLGLTVRYQDEVRPVLHTHVRFTPGSRNLFVLLPPERKDSFRVVAFRLQN